MYPFYELTRCVYLSFTGGTCRTESHTQPLRWATTSLAQLLDDSRWGDSISRYSLLKIRYSKSPERAHSITATSAPSTTITIHHPSGKKSPLHPKLSPAHQRHLRSMPHAAATLDSKHTTSYRTNTNTKWEDDMREAWPQAHSYDNTQPLHNVATAPRHSSLNARV